jgi:Holliday junction resolvase RusA-like endonuclease
LYLFEIPGNPIAQAQTQFACACPPKKKCHKWGYDPSKMDKERIQWQIRPFAPSEPLKGAVELSITFFLPIPKSTSAMKRKQMINRVILPTVKPDEDNLAYLVTNALKEIVYDDDRQVCVKHVYKYYSDTPKTVITVKPILQMQEVGHKCE